MQILFDIAGRPATFHRNRTTGSAQLVVGDTTTQLQDPLRLSTHFDFDTEQTWDCQIDGHQVAIVKQRPQFVGGLRKNSFTVSVDERVVATAEGY
jgi:hypothetical protein